MIPSGLQNVLEMIVEGLYNLTEGVSGPKWVARFFIIPTTIFIYVLVSNWFGLLPGLAGIGLCQEHHAEAAHAEEAVASSTTCPQGQVIVPFFRSPSADLNNTLMLALVTQVMAQVFGFSALGGGYLKKFFVFGGVAAAFKPDEHGNKRSFGSMMMQLAMGVIDIFVGLLEFLSEFVKIIAFTFRLFGNIFAGEVMLIVLTFLIPVMLTLPFLGLEVFVGAVQAFVFFILSIAFYTVAVTSHDHEEAH
jgi:F-type H+-transporting ATPase subunit a